MVLQIIAGLLIPLAVFTAFFSGYCFGKSDGLMRRDRPGWDKLINSIYRVIPKKWKGQ